MAESTLSISYSGLVVEVGVFLGYRSDSADWTPDQMAEVDRYIQAGVKQFYYPPAAPNVEAGYTWSFLSPTAILVTEADTGSYDLSDDMGRVIDDFYFDDQQHRPSVIQVGENRINACLQRDPDTGVPKVATVRYKAQVAGEGHRMEAVFYPTPDAVYTLHYQYEAYSGKLSESNPYPLGGMRYSELVLESCLSVAEQRANDDMGAHTASFNRLLATGVAYDRKQGAKCYGRMGQPQEISVARQRGNGYVTYKGNTW